MVNNSKIVQFEVCETEDKMYILEEKAESHSVLCKIEIIHKAQKIQAHIFCIKYPLSFPETRNIKSLTMFEIHMRLYIGRCFGKITRKSSEMKLSY